MTPELRRTLLSALLWTIPNGLALADCSLLLLVERQGGIALEAVRIPAGERRALALRPASGVISFILPLGEGKSADLIRGAGGGSIAAACAGEELTVSVHRADGGVRSLPPVSGSDLARLELRVNLKRGDGFERAFAVSSYTAVRAAPGPVLDLFGGRLPLGPDDWAITLEASASAALTPVEGEVSLLFDGEHLFAEGVLGSGRRALFVVDLAAASCVVRLDLLPPGTDVVAVSAVSHESGGAVAADARPIGVSGPVAGPSRRATIPGLVLGDLAFGAVEATVLDSLPQIGGREIGGIVGLDLLRRARVLEIAFGDGEHARLRLGASARLTGPALPFSLADRHLFLAGEVAGQALSLVVDTGAKVSLVGEELSRDLALEALAGSGIELRGLDRLAVVAPRARARQLRLAGESFADVDFAVVPELAALRAWGLEPRAAILGNDFWRRFRVLELDFERSLLRLEPGALGTS